MTHSVVGASGMKVWHTARRRRNIYPPLYPPNPLTPPHTFSPTSTPHLLHTSHTQVNTVLSDKTGTLTRNVMEFFKCSIGGVAYGAGVTEIEKSNAARWGGGRQESGERGRGWGA